MIKNKNSIDYEYKTVTISKKLQIEWEYVYSNLGWNIVERRYIKMIPMNILISSYDNMLESNNIYEKVDLKLKRSNKIKNKSRISKVETTIRETLHDINEVVDNKYKKHIQYICIGGIIGIMLFILSIISCINNNIISFIILGMLGSLIMLTAIIINEDIKFKKFIETQKLIEENFDKIYFLSSIIR